MNIDEIAKKLAGLGLPGIILVVLTVASAGSNAAIVAALTALGGPFGILGGIGLLGLVGVVGDTVGIYGFEAILKAVYSERTKNESVRSLVKESTRWRERSGGPPNGIRWLEEVTTRPESQRYLPSRSAPSDSAAVIW
jgi:hypothetical protein